MKGYSSLMFDEVKSTLRTQSSAACCFCWINYRILLLITGWSTVKSRIGVVGLGSAVCMHGRQEKDVLFIRNVTLDFYAQVLNHVNKTTNS